MRVAALTLKQLRALAAVARTGSLTAAAVELHLTTPAIHSQIRKLEETAGRALIERGRDGMRFVATPTGAVLLQAAARIEANLSQAEDQIEAMTRGHLGHVALIAVSTARCFAPRLVRMLRDTVPEIEVSLGEGNRRQVIAALRDRAVDLAVMGRPPRDPAMEALPLGPHPHGILLPPDHPMAGKDGFDPAALIEETFLAREEGSGTRILMMRYLDRLAEGAAPRLIAFESNETIKQAVMAGLGIGFLSLHTVGDELAQGRLALLRGPGLPVMRHWYLVHPTEPAPGAAAARIAAAVVGFAGAYLPRTAGIPG